MQEELRGIAGELGAARDWEVLAGSTLEAAFDAAPDEINADAEIHASREIASQNRKRAGAAVDSVRYTRLIIELTQWLDKAGWHEGLSRDQHAALDKPITKFASKTLRNRHRKLLKRGRNLPDLNAQRRHRARIAAKKLRYATEFFASLYPKQAVRDYKAALSQLQDGLGWRNNVVVADGLLKALASEHPETATGSGYACSYLVSRVAAEHDALQTLWERFRRLSPPH